MGGSARGSSSWTGDGPSGIPSTRRHVRQISSDVQSSEDHPSEEISIRTEQCKTRRDMDRSDLGNAVSRQLPLWLNLIYGP